MPGDLEFAPAGSPNIKCRNDGLVHVRLESVSPKIVAAKFQVSARKTNIPGFADPGGDQVA